MLRELLRKINRFLFKHWCLFTLCRSLTRHLSYTNKCWCLRKCLVYFRKPPSKHLALFAWAHVFLESNLYFFAYWWIFYCELFLHSFPSCCMFINVDVMSMWVISFSILTCSCLLWVFFSHNCCIYYALFASVILFACAKFCTHQFLSSQLRIFLHCAWLPVEFTADNDPTLLSFFLRKSVSV